jgi:hypothetical protein
MAPILSLILIGTGSLAALSQDYSFEFIRFNTHASELLACGGGGSGAYRKPPKPGHAKSGDLAHPRGTQSTSTDTKPVQTNMNSGQT